MRVEKPTAQPPTRQSDAPGGPTTHSDSLPGYLSAVSGAIAGLVAGTVVCPFDVVKTRLQVQSSFGGAHSTPSSMSATFRDIFNERGVRGLYSGLSPLLVGYLPSWTIYFYVYKKMQHLLAHGPASSLNSNNIPSAVVAGACSTLATNPIWMIKTRMMAQSKHTSWQYTSIADAARSIYRSEGIAAFYSGLGAALLGLPHVAIHFPLYEYLKARWAPQRQWQGFLAASVVSKVLASTVTYPHEVIRSRAQIRTTDGRYKGIIRTVKTLYREEGWRIFYAGLGANVCRAVPASAVTLMTFELVSFTLAELYWGGDLNEPLGEWLDDPLLSSAQDDSTR